MLTRLFAVSEPLGISYVDDDGDTCNVTNDNELREGFNVAENMRQPFKLKLEACAANCKNTPEQQAELDTETYANVAAACVASALEAGTQPDPFLHAAFCDLCNERIQGIRYKCAYCEDFDLCERCEATGFHDPSHLLLKIRRPVRRWMRKDKLFDSFGVHHSVDRADRRSARWSMPSTTFVVSSAPPPPPPQQQQQQQQQQPQPPPPPPSAASADVSRDACDATGARASSAVVPRSDLADVEVPMRAPVGPPPAYDAIVRAAAAAAGPATATTTITAGAAVCEPQQPPLRQVQREPIAATAPPAAPPPPPYAATSVADSSSAQAAAAVSAAVVVVPSDDGAPPGLEPTLAPPGLDGSGAGGGGRAADAAATSADDGASRVDIRQQQQQQQQQQQREDQRQEQQQQRMYRQEQHAAFLQRQQQQQHQHPHQHHHQQRQQQHQYQHQHYEQQYQEQYQQADQMADEQLAQAFVALVPCAVRGFGGRGPRGRGRGRRGGAPFAFVAAAVAPPPGEALGKKIAKFVMHVTIPNGMEVAPGDVFTKIWRFRNESQGAWPEGAEMCHVGGDMLGTVVAPAPVILPGEEGDVAVELTAPALPGRYKSFWRLTVGEARFGDRVWVEILVVPP